MVNQSTSRTFFDLNLSSFVAELVLQLRAMGEDCLQLVGQRLQSLSRCAEC